MLETPAHRRLSSRSAPMALSLRGRRLPLCVAWRDAANCRSKSNKGKPSVGRGDLARSRVWGKNAHPELAQTTGEVEALLCRYVPLLVVDLHDVDVVERHLGKPKAPSQHPSQCLVRLTRRGSRPEEIG